MSLFTSADVNFLGKRARNNLGEIRNLNIIIDEEAKRKGMAPDMTMTLRQATGCFEAGINGLFSNISDTTPLGRRRDVMRLK